MHSPNQILNGVQYLTPKVSTFSGLYTELREKEGRLLQDDEVNFLPNTSKNNPNKKEWLIRKKSADRFINYLKYKKESISILDIGCGNGWFSNKMASLNKGISIVGLDINEMELEQAVRVFNSNNIEFVYGDLFEIDHIFKNRFEIITLNASIQYFKDLNALLLKLRTFLSPNGEIHIIDTPFYQRSEIEDAKNRTQNYYRNMGTPEMSDHYYHHSIESVNEFEILYHPNSTFLKKLGFVKDSPFMWLRYTNFV